MKKFIVLGAMVLTMTIGLSQNSSTPPCTGFEANFTSEVYLPAGGIQFKNTSSVNNGTSLTYEWNFGNGNTSTEKDPFEMYNEGTYTIELKITDSNGCVSTKQKDVVFSYGNN
jgi:chitodextrinase